MRTPQLFKWSPRPDQSPEGSPASQSSSRFGALHHNVRSMINGSSVYSQSPNPNSSWNTPKPPFLSFLRREQSPAPIAVPNSNDPPRDSSDSRSPLHPQHTAGSYMRTIAPLQDPREPEMIYSHERNAPDRHPADVPLDYAGSGGTPDPETEQLRDEINGHNRHRRRRRHRRRKHHRQTHWTRRRNERQTCMPFICGTAARGKLMACIISGLFLATVLAIYLALALSRKDLGQEVHVLFIMIVLGTTIFFCHSLIRLCMLILHPPSEDASRPYIPSMTGPEGFHPVRPIQVHLARDEELSDEEDEIEGDGDNRVKEKVTLPPPAYGLWRSSVRVDPNLLHWQRVDGSRASVVPAGSNAGSRNGSVSGAAAPAGDASPEVQGPRPPSYISEDGVTYITEAQPRSIAPSHTGVSDIHPAWRPGYAVSEVPMDQWPRGARRP
ncbi:hypothetical protein K458DRAFT_319412 [Lentithecium fluviatile CBS 122367]|uniref:Uncharacterized protein n=1 Tax=Lentithecium fluviatile CBS 122367 TaxID=1168545 RepID=A0A6G1II18_9PLEO|nr:hypothetical protein K458DRAFT_319412 [Lentithecium fluviatile CBS 122367]